MEKGSEMQYRTVPMNGDRLSALGFGCMRLPTRHGGLGGLDRERAIRQIHFAIDNGVNYFDTSVMYGGSEEILGRALQDGYRDRVRIATKLPPSFVNSRDDMDRVLGLQLKNLQTDHVDYYLIHGLLSLESWERMKKLGVVDFLDTAKKDGRIRYAGFSSHCSLSEFKQILDDYSWDICQIQYNYLDVNHQAGIAGLRYAAEKNIGVVVMEPLRGGTLARDIPKPVQTLWESMDTKRSPAEWAFRWVWNHPGVTTILSGMNEEEHIAENIRVANEACPDTLTKEELGLFKKVEKEYHRMKKIGCTGCRYCMPCPIGVDIPGCFAAYNNPGGNIPLPPKIQYNLTIGGGLDGTPPKYASLCKNCGLCETKCPQRLPIRQHLGEVARTFETFDARILCSVIVWFMRLQQWRTLRRA